ncbi:hypothetical protein ABBQ38_002494 [Trebouxia sp. C0009 RCD-2024]
MSAVDLATSHLSSGEWDESDLYEPAASTLGSRYRRIVRSRSAIPAISANPSSDLNVNKLEVKAQPVGRSGLLAAQLKGSRAQSNLPVSASSNCAHSRNKVEKASNLKSSLATVDEVSSASVESTTSAVQLPLPVSPSSGNTSPLAVPTKRQNRNNWSLAAADEQFVPPHLLTAQTLPSDFVFAEESRPGSVLEGVGRKLRGSDAERFRRAVMRQTGFLEPKSMHHLPPS